MADTGFNWDADWTYIGSQVVLTQGATTTSTGSIIDLDVKAGAEVSIDATYSNHAKATGGLTVNVLRNTGSNVYEAEADGPWGFEMPFTQNGTNRRTFSVDPGQVSKYKIYLDWNNSTASSVVTVDVKNKNAAVPVAS